MNYEQHFQLSCDRRNDFWAAIGTIETDVLSHIINPALLGGPRWPSMRQAFLTIKTPETTILATEGLSDPYDDFDTNRENQPYNGLGVEFYVESPEPISEVKNSWQFDLVYQVAQFAAHRGDIINLMEKYGLLSTEIYDVRVPEEFVNVNDRVGVLLGLSDDRIKSSIDLSLETVRIINIKLLTVEELEYIAANGEEGREKVAELKKQQGNPTFSSLTRKSVI